MSYAVIELGGKQYRVEKGDSLLVDRLAAKEGAKVAPRALLYRDEKQTLLEGPELDKVRIDAVVAEHLKGEKIRVFKYRPKKRYRRRSGHRSLLTRLEIKEIKAPAARAGGRSTAREKAPSARARPAKATAARRERSGPAAGAAKKVGGKSAPAKKARARKSPPRN